MPAVRENSVDQAKPMMTSDSDRTDSSADQPDGLHLTRLPGEQVGEGKGDDDAADRATATASISEKPSTLPKKVDRKRA